jgi:hypothetical protein
MEPMPRALLLLAWLALVAAGPADIAGQYALRGVREAAGGIELLADGRFRYGFSYGALDETAEGRWTFDGRRVRLNTDPRPAPPSWRMLPAEAGDPALFQLMLQSPAGKPIPNIEVSVRMADGSVETAQTRQDWLEAPLDGRHVPVSVRFHIPVHEVTSPEFPLDVGAARRIRIQLDPGGLGIRDFHDWPLDWNDGLLSPPGARPGEGFQKIETAD